MTPIHPHHLTNAFWQAGILPQTGASIAFGRVASGAGAADWRDVLRPTAEADYGNSSKCSSFIMLPWCNRIKDAKLHFRGETYPLDAAPDDGTARHGEVRKHAWRVISADETHIHLSMDSHEVSGGKFPFAYHAEAEYRLEDRAFIWTLRLTSTDTRPMPAGFGHHPYFVRPTGENTPVVTIPCDREFRLEQALAVDAPGPVTPLADFRQPRPLDATPLDHLLTGCGDRAPVRLQYPGWNLSLSFEADPIFRHWLIFAPEGQPFFAVEPMSNANDGFNLAERGITESGVFVLQPGETAVGTTRLMVDG